MPIYEYQCEKCGKAAGFLVRNMTTHQPPACPQCGAQGMRRALSRFATPKARGGGGADAPPPAADGGEMPDLPELDGADGRDPRTLGRAMRRMADQAGETVEPEMEEAIRRLEAGEDPEKVGEEMEGAAGEGAGGGGDDTLYDG